MSEVRNIPISQFITNNVRQARLVPAEPGPGLINSLIVAMRWLAEFFAFAVTFKDVFAWDKKLADDRLEYEMQCRKALFDKLKAAAVDGSDLSKYNLLAFSKLFCNADGVLIDIIELAKKNPEDVLLATNGNTRLSGFLKAMHSYVAVELKAGRKPDLEAWDVMVPVKIEAIASEADYIGRAAQINLLSSESTAILRLEDSVNSMIAVDPFVYTVGRMAAKLGLTAGSQATTSAYALAWVIRSFPAIKNTVLGGLASKSGDNVVKSGALNKPIANDDMSAQAVYVYCSPVRAEQYFGSLKQDALDKLSGTVKEAYKHYLGKMSSGRISLAPPFWGEAEVKAWAESRKQSVIDEARKIEQQQKMLNAPVDASTVANAAAQSPNKLLKDTLQAAMRSAEEFAAFTADMAKFSDCDNNYVALSRLHPEEVGGLIVLLTEAVKTHGVDIFAAVAVAIDNFGKTPEPNPAPTESKKPRQSKQPA